jgi:hypothetical protein
LQLFPVVRPRTYCVIFFLLFPFPLSLQFHSLFSCPKSVHRCRSIGSSLRTPAPHFFVAFAIGFRVITSGLSSHGFLNSVCVFVSFVLPFSF